MLSKQWKILTHNIPDIDKNGATALYAVSLIPKTVVAGHGVRFFVGLPLIWSLLFVASLFVPPLVQGFSLESFSAIFGTPFGEVLRQEIPVVIAIAIVLFFLGLHEVARAAGLYDLFHPTFNARTVNALSNTTDAPTDTSVGSPLSINPSFVIPSLVGSIGGALGGIILVTGMSPDTGISLDRALMAFAAVFGANILANGISAVSVNPPMPIVCLNIDGEKKICSLLAHSEGHWYVFDRDNDRTEQYSMIRAIPDAGADAEVIWSLLRNRSEAARIPTAASAKAEDTD